MDWGSRTLGPRFTELDGDRTWTKEVHLWKDTRVGYILHYAVRDGSYVPFKWRAHRDLPRPPRKG